MNLTGGDLLVIFLVEGTLLSFFVFMVFFLRRSFPAPEGQRVKATGGKKKKAPDVNQLTQLLRESESLSRELAENLQEKKEVVGRLMSSLDAKIRDLNQMLEKTNKVQPVIEPGDSNGPEGNSQVLALARTGFPVPDIARRLGRSKEEVQLILDLEKIAVN